MNDKRETVGEAGEFVLIERIRNLCGGRAVPGVAIGIGDDAAVLEPTPGQLTLATCDIQVEDVHFRFDLITPLQLGRRAMAVNLSDIASMGGAPRVALVSLALPPLFAVDDFDALFTGMRDEMEEHSGGIAGGNLARSSGKLVIDIFMTGEAAPDRLLTRSGARAGDRLCVTGPLGSAAAGLDLLLRGDAGKDAAFAPLVRAHLAPVPRVREGQAIAGSGMATAMIDLSDGLASDLGHLCRASGVGAVVDAACVPVSEETRRAAALTGRPAIDYALRGGEDYELLFTWREESAGMLHAWSDRHAVAVREIGRITPASEGICLREASGAAVPLPAGGWDHFKQGAVR